MSDTPRTEELAAAMYERELSPPIACLRLLDFARTLEREINELKVQIAIRDADVSDEKCLRYEAECSNGSLRAAITEVLRISDRKHDAWDRARALLAGKPK